jgi:cell fate (sporulation/competence/biofilm development) regulator YlbF (YheA/YmcA/DUF963 family)
MEAMMEKAREVGRMISQTDEFKALKRANEWLSDDREAVERLNRLSDLQGSITQALQRGNEPSAEEREEYESLAESLQGMSVYQAVVAAQSNFERLMGRVNDEISKGIEAGEQSRIILSS